MTDKVRNFIVEGRELSLHLYEEAEKAISSWAVVESHRLSQEPWRRASYHVQPRNLNLGSAHHQIVGACLRDSMMTLGRMTDPTEDKKLTLFRLPNLLCDSEVIDVLRYESGQPAFDQALKFIQRRVVWDKNVRAKNWSEAQGLTVAPYTLMKFRAELDRFRNAMLAHASDRSELGGLWLDQFRRMLILCTGVTKASLLIFRGNDWDAKGMFRLYRLGQMELHRSISIEFLDPDAGPLARKLWERNFGKKYF